MPLPTQEEIIPRLRELPEPIRDFLGADATSAAIAAIAESYSLMPDALARLSRDIAFFVMEFLSAKEFIGELQNLAPQGKLADFRKDVAEKIFLPRARELRDQGIQIEMVAAIPTEPPTFAKAMPVRPAEAPAAKPFEPPKPPPPPITITPPAPAVSSGPAPAVRTLFMPPVMPAPVPKPAAPAMPVPPPPQAKPPSAALPTRIVITPEQPGIPKAPVAPPAPIGEKPPEPKPIRYTLPPVIREVPQVISVPKPPPTPPSTSLPPVSRVEPPKPPIAPLPITPPEKPGAEVIDLSTFQVTKTANPTPKPMPPGPKASGNTIDFKS